MKGEGQEEEGERGRQEEVGEDRRRMGRTGGGRQEGGGERGFIQCHITSRAQAGII